MHPAVLIEHGRLSSMPIRGAGGNDTLLGFGGNDWLNGAYGNDSLNGGAGQDLINGGPGADTLAGGLDADTFQFVSQYDSTGSDPSAIDYANTDVILDFSPRLGDKIDVQYLDANVLMPGDQAFDFNGVAAFTAPGQVSHFTDGTDTYPPAQHRRCMVNNYPDFEFAIRLAGQHTLEATFFDL